MLKHFSSHVHLFLWGWWKWTWWWLFVCLLVYKLFISSLLCVYFLHFLTWAACTLAVIVFTDLSSGPWTQRGAPLPYCCSAVAAALRRVSAAVAACGSTALWGGESPLHSLYLEYNWATSRCKSSQSTGAAVGFVLSLFKSCLCWCCHTFAKTSLKLTPCGSVPLFPIHANRR